MKQDTNHVLNSNENQRVTFEELHIRHLKLLIDLNKKPKIKDNVILVIPILSISNCIPQAVARLLVG